MLRWAISANGFGGLKIDVSRMWLLFFIFARAWFSLEISIQIFIMKLSSLSEICVFISLHFLCVCISV